MKTFKQFLEYKEQIISSEELVEMVRKLHLNHEDFEEGDLEDRIRQHDFYKLVDADANDIKADMWNSDDDLVSDYEEEYKSKLSYPPVVLDDDRKTIIDGTHRIKALKNLGHKTIKAWVPV
jgi:hypothetical protein